MEKKLKNYDAIGAELESLAKVDQEMRKKSIENHDLWDETIDHKNTERLKAIIAEIGLPTASKVGQLAASSAWLLAQHADHDPEFQTKYLNLMKIAPEGEVSKRNIAYLEDRIAVASGEPQNYGTQFFEDSNGRLLPCPIKGESSVDDRRKSMGLETLSENQQRMQKLYG